MTQMMELGEIRLLYNVTVLPCLLESQQETRLNIFSRDTQGLLWYQYEFQHENYNVWNSSMKTTMFRIPTWKLQCLKFQHENYNAWNARKESVWASPRGAGMGDTRTPSGQRRASCSHWSGEAEVQITTVKASRVLPMLQYIQRRYTLLFRVWRWMDD